MRRNLFILCMMVLGIGLAACDTGGDSSTNAQQKAQQGNQQLQSQVYVPHNNIEFNNYNRRQQIADEPSTILWCTAYLNNPNVKPITVPIVGKLTSSNKRPYATSQVQAYASGDSGTYSPELPGPDKMYGSSSEYRYGFTPADVYIDFTDIPTICTTQPTVYQATQTQILLETDPALSNAAAQAQAALKAHQQPNGTISAEGYAQALQALRQATAGH